MADTSRVGTGRSGRRGARRWVPTGIGDDVGETGRGGGASRSVLALAAALVLSGALLVAGATALLVALAGGAQASAGSGWRWPVDPPRSVVRPFAPGATRYSAGHLGADLAAPTGAPVRAVGAGRVTYSGLLAGRGVVVVEHAGGLRTTYEPLDRAVRLGQQVDAGGLLGRLTAGHPCPRSCLHLGLRRGQDYLDPLSLFGGPPRLLPLQGGPVAGRSRAAAGVVPPPLPTGSGKAAGPQAGAGAGPLPGALASSEARVVVPAGGGPASAGSAASPSAGRPPVVPLARVAPAPSRGWRGRVARALPQTGLAAALLAAGLVLVRRPPTPGPAGGSAGGFLPGTPAAAERPQADGDEGEDGPAADVVPLDAWRGRRSG